ncbi:MAG: hypothetical protein LBD55_10065 [Treponema sp.]|nr:hypothetical protein [Treponema sp.]
MKSKVVSGMSGLLLAFAMILTGCGDGGGGDDGGGSLSVTGEPVYTAEYSGSNKYYITGPRYSGQEYQLIGKNGSNSSSISIGNIGSLSADGALTLNLPADPPANALFDAPAQWGISAKLLDLDINLVNSIDEIGLKKSYFTGSCSLVYADRDTPPGNNDFPALKKGWQYVAGGGGMTPTASHTIPEGFQWAVYRK